MSGLEMSNFIAVTTLGNSNIKMVVYVSIANSLFQNCTLIFKNFVDPNVNSPTVSKKVKHLN